MVPPTPDTPVRDTPADVEQAADFSGAQRRGLLRRRRVRWALGGAAVVVVGLGLVWSARAPLADHLIAETLEAHHVPGHWRVEGVEADRLVLADVRLGDPRHPDFQAERVVVEAGWHGWGPGLGRITLLHPRLRGRVVDGKVSLGSLDPLLAGPSGKPLALPDIDLVLADGRMALATPWGPLGVGLTGAGRLTDGFAGRLALVAPAVRQGDCRGGARYGGVVRVAGGAPRADGVLALAAAQCGGVAVAGGVGRLALRLAPELVNGEADLALASGALRLPEGIRGTRATVDARLALRDGRITTEYTLAGEGLAAPAWQARRLTLTGRLRAPTDFARAVAEGTVTGEGLSAGAPVYGQLHAAQARVAATPLAPLLARFDGALHGEAHDGRLMASYTLHAHDGHVSLLLPEGRLRGASGANLLAISRWLVARDGHGPWHMAGHFATAGIGLPQLSGDEDKAGRWHLALADYAAGEAHLAVPHLALVPGRHGLGVTGELHLSGAVAGEHVQDLALPLDGQLSAQGDFAMAPGCAQLRAAGVEGGDLRFGATSLRLCPDGEGALLAYTHGRGLRVAARMAGLDLNGALAGDPLHLASGAITLHMAPGQAPQFAAQNVELAMGRGEEVSRYGFAALSGTLDRQPAGAIAGAHMALAAVPLDVREARGQWRWADGALVVDGLAGTVADRAAPDMARFAPLTARDGQVVLKGGVLSVDAQLREATTDRPVAQVALAHDFNAGAGHADLTADSLTFDKTFQPVTLSPLARGVIADAAGSVSGTGRIDWRKGVVTSHGHFATPGLDFAAAFGPVKGLSGDITFTDLLGLVSAPDQHVKVAAINPGIEVDDGVVTFSLLPGHVLALAGAEWPFLDGRLTLLPTRMVLGATEVRHYELVVSSIDAARFLARMDMSNLSATGHFDGRLPLVFDARGGRVVGGVLVSRPPGGNVSYVGALTYKDMNPMANYAFRMLRSLNYSQMRIDMDGDIAGEIVTKVSMEGVHQGKGATRNFITRQIAHVPIRFNVNVRAPFFQLVTSMRSLYDPTYVVYPRGGGLLGADGKPVPAAPAGTPATPAPATDHRAPDTIQPPASEPHL